MNNILIGSTLLLGCSFGLYKCVNSLLQPPASANTPEKGKDGKRLIYIQDVAPAWCPKQPPSVGIAAPPKESASPAVPVLSEDIATATEADAYQNKVIQKFWDVIDKSVQAPFRSVIQNLLWGLDDPEEQETSSVARMPGKPKEHDNNYEDDVFAILAKTPIWRHLLDTAEEYIKSCEPKERRGPLFWTTVIACLGHDLGKMRPYLKTYYATGNHARMSGDALAKIIGSNLTQEASEEIIEAVRQHHDDPQKGMSAIAYSVKQADKRARERELRSFNQIQNLEQESTPRHGHNSKALGVPWFKPAEFIKILELKINTYLNRNTYSFSMRDGLVYFSPNIIFGAFMELAIKKQAPETHLFSEIDDRVKLLIFISDEMREYGALAGNFVSVGYHAAPFKITYKGTSERITKNYFSVYRSDIFKISLGQIEKDKPPQLQIISKVERAHGK